MRLDEIARRLGADFASQNSTEIVRVADLRQAGSGDIAFLSNSEYADALRDSLASAVLVRAEDAALAKCPVVIVRDPYLAFAKVAQWLDPTPQLADGIHSSAIIAPDAVLASDARIAAGVVIGTGAHVGAAVQIGAGSVIGEGCVIGAGSRIWANVTLYHGVRLGQRCIVHSGTVLGSDGFGYASEQRRWVKIPQTGGVSIGDEVEIGANCTIDRGALTDTVIGNGVKLDNLVHIAHNVEIGDHSAAAAMTGIAGSTKLGKHVTLAGRVSIVGHLQICDGAHVTACTTVTKSITTPGAYSSGTTMQPNKEWRKSVARFFQLDELFRRVRDLERHQKSSDENTK